MYLWFHININEIAFDLMHLVKYVYGMHSMISYMNLFIHKLQRVLFILDFFSEPVFPWHVCKWIMSVHFHAFKSKDRICKKQRQIHETHNTNMGLKSYKYTWKNYKNGKKTAVRKNPENSWSTWSKYYGISTQNKSK